MRYAGLLLLVCSWMLAPAGRAQDQVFLTPEEALAEVFPEGRYFQHDTLRFLPEELEAAKQVLRRTEPLDSMLVVTRVYNAEGQFLGYA